MPARLLWILVLVSCLSGSDKFPPARGQKQTVQLPPFGEVDVEGSVRAHGLPEVSVTSAGKQLYRIELGAGTLDTRYIDPGDPKADPFPIVRFKVLTLPRVSTPIIFAAAMEAGGSDCSYMGALVGDVGGRMSALLPQLPVVNAEGGYAIGELEKGRGLEFAAWNMIWRNGEAHVDPHDYWVRIYRLDAATGKFAFVRRYEVKKSEPEISFPNLLREIPDFGC
jgi:hypothetical protein